MRLLYKEKFPMLFLVVIFLSFFVVACQSSKKEKDASYHIYFLAEGHESLKSNTYRTSTPKEETELLLEEIEREFQAYIEDDDTEIYKDFIQGKTLDSTILTVDVKADFLSLDFSEQVLLRAALVRNFTQIKRVHYVKMTVNNEELLDSKGIPVGLMKKDDFVENSGKEINSYVYSVLRFFYPSVEKDRLIYQEKKVYYSSNVPIERVVLEQVLKQSSDSHIINLIPGDTQIINVTVADNICYINLSKEFLKIENEEDARLALYSIVNSISTNCFVDYVQFSVEGDANVSLADKISLRQLFQVNEKLNEGGGDNE